MPFSVPTNSHCLVFSALWWITDGGSQQMGPLGLWAFLLTYLWENTRRHCFSGGTMWPSPAPCSYFCIWVYPGALLEKGFCLTGSVCLQALRALDSKCLVLLSQTSGCHKLSKSSGLQAFYLRGKERGDQRLMSAGFYCCVPWNRSHFQPPCKWI